MSAAADGFEGKSTLRNSLQACIHEENAFSACQNALYIAMESREKNQCALDRVGASDVNRARPSPAAETSRDG
jgi:hypothetical protein